MDKNLRTRTGNDLPTRVAILEQSFMALGQDQTHVRDKVDRLNAYIFGSDRDEDGMKFQVKALVKQVEGLTKTLAENQVETMTIRKQGFERLEALEDRQKVLETWRQEVQTIAADKKGLSRQYIFMLVSTIAGSTISILIGWALAQALTP